jgi:hypothetical protein
MTLQANSFLSLLSERREMRDFQRSHLGLGEYVTYWPTVLFLQECGVPMVFYLNFGKLQIKHKHQRMRPRVRFSFAICHKIDNFYITLNSNEFNRTYLTQANIN